MRARWAGGAASPVDRRGGAGSCRQATGWAASCRSRIQARGDSCHSSCRPCGGPRAPGAGSAAHAQLHSRPTAPPCLPAATGLQWTAALSLPTRASGESLTIRVPGGTDPNFYVQGAPVRGQGADSSLCTRCCGLVDQAGGVVMPAAVPARLLLATPRSLPPPSPPLRATCWESCCWLTCPPAAAPLWT